MFWNVQTRSRYIIVVPMVLPMAPLYSLGPNDQNEVKHDFYSYVMPLIPPLLLRDANYITTGIILFISWRNLSKVWHDFLVIWCCWHQCEHHMTLIALSVTPFHFLSQNDWNKVQHNLFGHVIPVFAHMTLMALLIAFVTSRWSKWDATWHFCSFDTDGTGISIMWCQWHCQ